MQKAIIYCRVSTEEQARDGRHSLAAQESLCRKAAQDTSLEIAAVYSDPGRTATNMNRPGLQDALSRCQEDPSIKALLVQDTDRLARNTKDHLTIRAMLKKCDVKLISVSQPMLEDSAEGNMIDTIIASVNQFQSDITKRKTLKGLEEKVRKGGWPAKAPLGYKNVGIGPDGSTRVVQIDPQTAALVQEMFRLYATGGYSLIRLADYLFTCGLRSCTGKRVAENKLHLMLQNEFYVGIVNWHGMRTTGSHEPIIDESTFHACGTVLHSHGGGFSRKRKHDFLLRGYLICASCGRRLIGESHINKRAAYYRCHTRNCEPPIRIGDAERAVEEEFEKITMPEPALDEALSALYQQAEIDKSSLQGRKEDLLARRAALIGRKDKLEAKWLSGVVDDDDFKRLNEDVKEQIQSINISLLHLESRKQTDIESIAEVIAFTRLLDVTYAQAAPHIKRLLLQFAFEGFEVHNRRIAKAIPSKFMGALAGARQIAQIAHEPVLVEQAFVSGSNHHPTQTSISGAQVRLRPKWGPKRATNRPQKGRKVSGGGKKTTLNRLTELLRHTSYMHQVLNLYGEIVGHGC